MPAHVTWTSYGRRALDALRTVVANLKQDDPLHPVTLVVPSNVAGIVARRHLAHGFHPDRPAVAGLWVTTLPRLAEQLAAPRLTGAGRRPATRAFVAATVRGVLQERPGIFREVADHPSTARALARAHHDLRDVDDMACEGVAGTSNLCADVVRVHRAARERMAGGHYDETDLLHTAAATLTVGRAAELGSIVIYLPQEFTHAQAGLAAVLAQLTDTHVVAGHTGDPRADSAVLETVHAVVPGAPPPPARTPRTVDRIAHASDSDDEVRCAVREVVRALRTTPAHRVAVLYAARDPYARLLHEHLAAAGIEVNGPGVRPVAERAVARLVLGLLEIARTGYRRADVLRTIGELPVVTFSPASDGSADPVPLPLWERLTREAGVVAGDDWQDRLSFHQQSLEHRLQDEVYDSTRDRLTRHRDAAAAMQTFMTTLRERLDGLDRAATWTEAAETLRGIVDAVLPPATHRRLPPAEQHALVTVRSALSQLHALDGTPTTPSLTGVEEILGLELDGALPRVGTFGRGVLVAPVEQAVGLDLDVVHVLGLAEDLCPGTLREDSLLPERAREATGWALRSTRRRPETTHRALLAAFHSAAQVTASFPRGDLRRHSHRLPSRWLLPSLRVLSGQPDLPATEWERGAAPAGEAIQGSPSFAGTLSATMHPATEQEWRVRAHLSGVAPADPVVTATTELLQARRGDTFSRFDGNLAGVAGLPDHGAGTSAVSPTALESYASCPHAYFVQRLLRVEPVETPEEIITISASDLGSLVHEAMDGLVREAAERGKLPGYGQPWSAAQRARLLEFGDEVGARYEAEGRTGHPRLWARHRQWLRTVLDRMLTDDDAWRAEHKAAVVASELTFGLRGAPPVEVTLADGRTVHLRGSADKVDRRRDGTLLVTDIKTGRKNSFKDIDEDDPVLGGSKLQLPAYAVAVRAAHGEAHTPVEALYWFTGRDTGRVQLPLTTSVMERYAETLGLLVDGIARGSFPQRAPKAADFNWVQCSACNPDGRGHATIRERWEMLRATPELRDYTALVEPDALVEPADASEEDER
ncbi:PD-(D/E)XK nuclease family protein [Ornithinimicrobium pratense]|uniref:PD-(D/E)XK nuclease family protein n=1 Tax=Ornithinimicrobium pratense TaxID=2593973 RepID=A0A5J6V842_9MICO|nr:PD-(D/E)XK nuclease family protein [Ornithinimicrobium pratense]QFG69233.1 PD-(D/E)XK nuclease family protein [Ornithinimicrobium pratense]